jgi:hypothetical protein
MGACHAPLSLALTTPLQTVLTCAAARSFKRGMAEPLDPPAGKKLSPQAERALKEAAERRALREANAQAASKEFGGPSGLEPTRYGDWEKKGLTSDF